MKNEFISVSEKYFKDFILNCDISWFKSTDSVLYRDVHYYIDEKNYKIFAEYDLRFLCYTIRKSYMKKETFINKIKKYLKF